MRHHEPPRRTRPRPWCPGETTADEAHLRAAFAAVNDELAVEHATERLVREVSVIGAASRAGDPDRREVS